MTCPIRGRSLDHIDGNFYLCWSCPATFEKVNGVCNLAGTDQDGPAPAPAMDKEDRGIFEDDMIICFELKRVSDE